MRVRIEQIAAADSSQKIKRREIVVLADSGSIEYDFAAIGLEPCVDQAPLFIKFKRRLSVGNQDCCVRFFLIDLIRNDFTQTRIEIDWRSIVAVRLSFQKFFS